MICRILLLIAVTSCVRGKQHRLALNYQAEENHNVTVEWQFSFNTGMSVNSVKIHCVFLFSTQLKVFFNLDESRVPRAEEHQHEQFSGRVRCDKDALSTGLVRLHLSRVRTEDTGLYLCRMATDFGKIVKKFSLNVTAAVDRPVTPCTQPPKPVSRVRACLYAGLGLVAAAAAVVLSVYCCITYSSTGRDERGTYNVFADV